MFRRALAISCLLFAAGGTLAEVGEPVTVRDPHYGDVLFHFYKGDYFESLVRLTAAQEKSRVDNHAEEAELLKGGLALSYGLHEEAGEIFDALLASTTKPEIRDRTWFFMAKIRYQRGYLDEAGQALAAIGGELPKELEPERRLLHAQILIQQERFDEAIALLDGWKGPKGWSDYARYNLGVALVRGGRFADGAALLERVGRLSDDRDEMLGLKDKANVALGFTWLKNEQPERARPILQRVRLNGPFSTKALLGVGWADSDKGDYRSALTPWTELQARNVLDAAVQESLLAVPYALGKLNATRQAAAEYESAILTFSREQQRLEAAIADIDSGRMLERLLDAPEQSDASGWYWQLNALPDSTEGRYLYLLMASHQFQEGLKNYRDTLALRENLQNWKSSIVVFESILETRAEGYATRLPQIEQSLEAADIGEIRERHAAMQARLNDIESRRDVIALANRNERRAAEELALVKQNPVLQYSTPEIEDARNRIRLMEGVLRWSADRDFPARVWRQRKALQDIGRVIVAAERARFAVDDARINEPAALNEFDARIRNLEPRINEKLIALEQSLDRQRGYLHGLAKQELRQQYERLDTYTVQARFALAAVYDRATAASNANGASEDTQ
ncbi:MAG: hypothetical protein AAAFM81_10705 [Pseudomonadota bacterium]